MADKLDKTSRVWERERRKRKDESVNEKNGTSTPFLQVDKNNLRKFQLILLNSIALSYCPAPIKHQEMVIKKIYSKKINCVKERIKDTDTRCLQTYIDKNGNITQLIWGDFWLISKALTRESLICTIVNINVTKPYQTLLLIRLHVVKSTLLKCILLQHIYLQYYPSSIYPSVTPHSSTFSLSYLLLSEAPPHRSTLPTPLSPRSPSLSLPHSPLSFFLSTPLNLY